nr:hypothetical protein [Fredinandcohnia onubensis]
MLKFFIGVMKDLTKKIAHAKVLHHPKKHKILDRHQQPNLINTQTQNIYQKHSPFAAYQLTEIVL